MSQPHEEFPRTAWGERTWPDDPLVTIGPDKGRDEFRAHLDECAQCRRHPHALCAKGAELIRKAVGA